MNKLFLVLQCILLLAVLMKIPAKAENDKPELRVQVNHDGSVTVAILPTGYNFKNDDDVRIYKHEDRIVPGSENNPLPLVWWFARPERTVTYPGETEIPVLSSCRTSELSCGEGSALRPGTYYAVIVGKHHILLTDPAYFKIPEHVSAAAPSPEPTAMRTPSAAPHITASPLKIKEISTLSPATVAAKTTPGEFDFSDDDSQRTSGIAALAVLLLAIIAFLFLLYKRK